MSNEGAVASQEAGSRLIMALCRANEIEGALAVYEDMVLASTPECLQAATPKCSPPSAISDTSTYSSPPSHIGADSLTNQHPETQSSGDSSDSTEQALRLIQPDATAERSSSLESILKLTAADQLGFRRRILYEDKEAGRLSGEDQQPAASTRTRRWASRKALLKISLLVTIKKA